MHSSILYTLLKDERRLLSVYNMVWLERKWRCEASFVVKAGGDIGTLGHRGHDIVLVSFDQSGEERKAPARGVRSVQRSSGA